MHVEDMASEGAEEPCLVKPDVWMQSETMLKKKQAKPFID